MGEPPDAQLDRGGSEMTRDFQPGDLITVKKCLDTTFPLYCTRFSDRAVFTLEKNQVGLVVQHAPRGHLVGVMWECGAMGWISHQLITTLVEVT